MVNHISEAAMGPDDAEKPAGDDAPSQEQLLAEIRDLLKREEVAPAQDLQRDAECQCDLLKREEVAPARSPAE